MYQQLLNKKGPFLLVTFCSQKQAMDLVHRKCFGGRKSEWEQWMDDWFPSIPLQHFNAHRQAQVSSQEQRTESELSAPLRSQACFNWRMLSPAPGTTKLSQAARLQSKLKTEPQPTGVDPSKLISLTLECQTRPNPFLLGGWPSLLALHP